jgi:hypothetical protein
MKIKAIIIIIICYDCIFHVIFNKSISLKIPWRLFHRVYDRLFACYSWYMVVNIALDVSFDNM